MWIDDQIISQCSKPLVTDIWIPSSTMVVLGSSNQAEKEVDLTWCAKKQIPVLKRYGGGGAVVLYEGCVVVSFATWVRHHFNNAEYFRTINRALLESLSDIFPADISSQFSQQGISDLCFAERKFGGTSLFRSRNFLLYQASLLIQLDLAKISGCLKHPSSEPAYRAKRSHESFLIGLDQIQPMLTCQAVEAHLKNSLEPLLIEAMRSECISPIDKQIPTLHARSTAG